VREWSAEVLVDEERARRLIDRQFPELELGSLRLLAEGWDNAVWLVDERWAFRFPRRAIAVAGVEREMDVLPRLAPLLPLPIPVPVHRGRPADGYPWPFFGSLLLPGVEACDAGLDDDARVRLARPLGAFIRALHSVELAEIVRAGQSLPVDPFGRADMARRVPRAHEAIAEVERLGLWRAPSSVERLLLAARRLPPPARLVVVHGDLYFRHLLVSRDGALTGVIDWGDLGRAGPSVDLQLAWSFLPADGRADFLDAYGPVAEEDLVRARVLALFHCGIVAAYGHHERLANVEREAVGGLARTVVG